MKTCMGPVLDICCSEHRSCPAVQYWPWSCYVSEPFTVMSPPSIISSTHSATAISNTAASLFVFLWLWWSWAGALIDRAEKDLLSSRMCMFLITSSKASGPIIIESSFFQSSWLEGRWLQLYSLKKHCHHWERYVSPLLMLFYRFNFEGYFFFFFLLSRIRKRELFKVISKGLDNFRSLPNPAAG